MRLPIRDEDLAFLPLALGKTDDRSKTAPEVVLRSPFAGKERTWNAWIVRTEGELDPETRMVNLIAQVAAPYEQGGDTPPLTVGLFVQAQILGREFDRVVTVPRSAVREGDRVHVVAPDGRLEFRDVEVLRRDGETVYLQSGVRDGEIICLTDLVSATEGQRVVPASSPDATTT